MTECSMHGCKDKDKADFNTDIDQYGGPYKIENEQYNPRLDDVIIIRRETHTVRAIEPMSGSERWNFSVGTHSLELMKSGDCHNRPYSEYDQVLLDLELKVIVPEGIICAVHKHTPNVILWQHKFNHPIVNAWKNSNDDLIKLDLFSYTHLPFGINEATMDGLSPSVYVAMYDKQLYIQESDNMKRTPAIKDFKNVERLRIPWKPFSIPSTELAMIEGAIQSKGKDDTSATALSVLEGSEYVNGNGFYLFTNIKAKKDLICEHNLSKLIHDDEEDEAFEMPDDDDDTLNKGEVFELPLIGDDDDTPTKVLIVSLWFWW